MLSDFKRKKARQIAKELAFDGMIWGKELEQFIEAEIYNGFINLKELEKDLFLDVILDWVQVIYDRLIKIYDVETGETKIFISVEDVSKVTCATGSVIRNAVIRGTSFKNKRYYAAPYIPKIKDINKGLKNIDKIVILTEVF